MVFSTLLAIDFGRASNLGISETVALALVALIGYVFGHRLRKHQIAAMDAQRQRELERAADITQRLETIAGTLRQDLAAHHCRLARFKRRLSEAQAAGTDAAWELLRAEAEEILVPTMQLAEQLSLAYDAIRQQSDALETFTRARIDPLTGVSNGRAMAEKLGVLLAAAERGGPGLSVALVSLDRDPTTAANDAQAKKKRLPELARLIKSCMREDDFAARYGDEDFVVLMPQTKLSGADVFGERLRKCVIERMGATVSCGIAEYQTNDDQKSLLGRADSAFYSAKAAGENRQFLHVGSQIREHRARITQHAENDPPTPDAAPIPFASDTDGVAGLVAMDPTVNI